MKYQFEQKQIKRGKVISFTLYGDSKQDLAEKLSKLRTKRGIRRNEFVQCMTDVEAHAKEFNGLQKTYSNEKKSRNLTLSQVVHGAKALVNIVRGDVVDGFELQRRAAICASCELISPVSIGCTSCAKKGLSRLARDLAVQYGRNFIVPRITTTKIKPPKGGSLSEFYCGFCGCSCLNLCLSKSKSFLDKEEESRPDHCWANPNGKNWRP